MNGLLIAALPPGVVAFGGWANRLLIVAYRAWAIGAAWCAAVPRPTGDW